jgi:activator of HSP90 ATPase
LKDSIKLSAVFPVNAKRLYDAWLTAEDHSAFTEGKAEISAISGTKFSVWNGYIKGSNLILQPYGRIVQSWRTTDFPDSCGDSKLEILFEKTEKGTKLTLIHSNIPDGDGKKYEKGWKKHYLIPMKKYFRNNH